MAVLKMILIKKATAEKIFDLIEKFAGYGFNKSHSAAYAMLSYQTAYLKTYFPEHFSIAFFWAIHLVNYNLKTSKSSFQNIT